MAKILIVDDIIDNITLLTFELEDDGHEVVALNNGQACLDEVETIWPDIILLDVMMPVRDGISTLRELKGSPATASIPVIMVSANDDDDRVVEALDLGAHDYVSKPFVYPILSARMRSALRLQESQHLLALANRNLARLASIDPLTGTYNRRHFLERADKEVNKAKRHKRPFSVIMLDVDHFKNINDQYGHSMGDAALAELSKALRMLIRGEDFVGRLGGEEFAICCPDTDLEGAQVVAQRILFRIRETQIHHKGVTCNLTVSLGVALLNEEDTNFDQIYDRADQLLYQAKSEGRDRMVVTH